MVDRNDEPHNIETLAAAGIQSTRDVEVKHSPTLERRGRPDLKVQLVQTAGDDQRRVGAAGHLDLSLDFELWDHLMHGTNDGRTGSGTTGALRYTGRLTAPVTDGGDQVVVGAGTVAAFPSAVSLLARVRAMAVPHADLTSRTSTEQPRWERISEAEARATVGDDAIDDALAEVGAKGRASADRYRAAGHSVADQS